MMRLEFCGRTMSVDNMPRRYRRSTACALLDHLPVLVGGELVGVTAVFLIFLLIPRSYGDLQFWRDCECRLPTPAATNRRRVIDSNCDEARPAPKRRRAGYAEPAFRNLHSLGVGRPLGGKCLRAKSPAEGPHLVVNQLLNVEGVFGKDVV